MLKNKVIYVILAIFVLVLYGLDVPVHAEQVEKTVKDFYEKSDNINKSSTEKQHLEENVSNDQASTGFSFLDFLRMIAATIFVVALLYFVLKFINKKSRSYQKVRYVQNLGGTSLGSNRSVQLVKVGNSILVVGVGESIQLLKEINDPKEYQELLDSFNEDVDTMLQAGDLFSRMLNKKKHEEITISFTETLKKQLQDISQSRKKISSEVKKKGNDSK
ncbi:flagellar biosynthetic protein FliO [Peribacillus tepidiphilus]|uniref:flagellar biosynthetic protein FliO n=1 Tax=Peribacillus tepidiphilus TaxID=2652445 RepID=UPI00129258EC|nr:flagellar biosynthetic protein FliO [Peribacillus tepidiphilus]